MVTMLVLSVVSGVTVATSTSDNANLKSNITVTSLGLDTHDHLAKFRVANDADQNVTLSWKMYGVNNTGTVDVAAHGSSTFTMQDVDSNQTNVIVRHNGTKIARVQVSDQIADFGDDNNKSDDSDDNNKSDDGNNSDNSNCDDTQTSITFDAQSSDGDSVTVQQVTLKHGGYVVLTDKQGNVVGQSDYLEAGTHKCINIELTTKFCQDTKLKATLYADSGGNDNADWSDGDSDSDGNDDGSSNLDHPVMNGNSSVSDWGCINICDN